MATLNVKYPNITDSGPLINILFAVPLNLEKITSKGRKKEPIGPLPILVDTGASHSCIDEEIPKKLGLKPIRKQKISTPSCESYEANVYHLRVIVPELNLSYERSFTGTKSKNQNIHGLLGRDMLKGLVLIYNTIDNSLNICF